MPDLSEQAVLLWTSREIGGLGCNYSKTPIRTRMSRIAKDIVEIGARADRGKRENWKLSKLFGLDKIRIWNERRRRRMLNEKQVLSIVPISRTTLYRAEKEGRFRGQRTSRRTGGFGTKMKSWRGRTRSTSSIRTVAGAKVVAIMHRTDKSAFEGKPGTEWC